jgi:hypothetical protein
MIRIVILVSIVLFGHHVSGQLGFEQGVEIVQGALSSVAGNNTNLVRIPSNVDPAAFADCLRNALPMPGQAAAPAAESAEKKE